MKNFISFCSLILALLFSACNNNIDKTATSSKIIMPGVYPYVTEYNGTFYFTLQAPPPNTIAIYASSDLDSIAVGKSKVVYDGNAEGMMNIWSPELARLRDKWYIYFEADNGNTDNHQIFVLENINEDPMVGEWTLRGPIVTDEEWNFGIHPSTICIEDRQYLFWSGWQHRRTETETQAIFIAEMENPWTLKSKRTMISVPEYVWELQWINPDGSRSAYPIFVNENPQPFLSDDGKNIIVGYSASGIWTKYNALGMLYASTDSDLLNAESWSKMEEPQFCAEEGSEIFGTSNISVVTNPADNVTYMMYQAKEKGSDGIEYNNIRLKTIGWDEFSLPVFGSPERFY